MRSLLFLFSFFCIGNACSTSSASGTTTSVESTFEKIDYEAFLHEQFEEVNLDQVPRPENGDLEFLKAVYRKLNYPMEARSNGVQGAVFIMVVLDEFGELVDAQVSEGLGYGCDEEALTAIYRAFSVTTFQAAVYQGKPVKVRFEIPVKFKLV